MQMQTNSWRQSQCRKLPLLLAMLRFVPTLLLELMMEGLQLCLQWEDFACFYFLLNFLFIYFFILCVLCWIKWKFNWFALASALTMAKAKYAKGVLIVGVSFCHAHMHMLSFKGNELLNQQVWKRINNFAKLFEIK